MSRAKARAFEDELETLLGRVKEWIGSDVDADVARALGVASSSIPTWRKRGTVPYGELVQWAYKYEVPMDWLFSGGPYPSCEPVDVSRLRTKEEAGKIKESASLGGVDWGDRSERQSSDLEKEGFTLVPRYDIKGSMGGGQLIHSEQVVDHLAFRTEWVRSELRANPANLVLISAVGDSMEPSLSSGDLLLVDKSEYKIRDDAIYVISVNGSLLVKRVQMLLDGTVIIRSDNPAYQIQTVKQPDIEQIKIVGRVVWIGRRV